MSMNSRYRERKYNTSDNDRLLRALSQPVQAWEKKWTQHSNSKTLQTYKWIKSDKVIEFEQDDESEEEAEAMEIEQEAASASMESTTTAINTATTTDVKTTVLETTNTTLNELSQETTTTEAMTTSVVVESSDKPKDTIPGGPNSILSNKPLSSVQDDEDDQRSQTPKLDDISDEEPDPTLDNDDDDNDVDSINDPSKHPALAPHAQARMTDDELAMTDSNADTPQTEGNTPMPLLEEDDDMEEAQVQQAPPHPLSQEIYSSLMTEDVNSLNNDSPAIQTPEDIVNTSDPMHGQQDTVNQPQE